MKNMDDLTAQDKRLRERFGPLFDEALAILDRYDPIGIALFPGEYEPEVGTILPRLNEAHSAIELRHIIHEEFMRWFNTSDAALEEWRTHNSAGPEEN
ncbi:MAG: hypothetical protein ACR2M0_12475 [Chloroflexia bacterium]